MNPLLRLNMLSSHTFVSILSVYCIMECSICCLFFFMRFTPIFPVEVTDLHPVTSGSVNNQWYNSFDYEIPVLGDPRSNQNPAILAFGILMFRWHNELASRIQAEYPNWSDEEIFQRSRRLVIASLQNIIMYEYLPALLNEDIEPYTGYKPDVHPGVSHVFQSAAFRFGHTMIPPGLYRRNAQCEFKDTVSGYPGMRLCSTWWTAEVRLCNLCSGCYLI